MAFPIWPQAWRDNLPVAGQAEANTRVGEMHGTMLPNISDIVGAQERCIEKLVCSPDAGNIDLFAVAGGPIIITELVGIVTTIIGGTTNLQVTGAGVDFTSAVDIDGWDVPSLIYFTDADPPVVTQAAAGAMVQFPRHYWLCPEGDIVATFSATVTGNIEWYMAFKPLSPQTTVVTL